MSDVNNKFILTFPFSSNKRPSVYLIARFSDAAHIKGGTKKRARLFHSKENEQH